MNDANLERLIDEVDSNLEAALTPEERDLVVLLMNAGLTINQIVGLFINWASLRKLRKKWIEQLGELTDEEWQIIKDMSANGSSDLDIMKEITRIQKERESAPPPPPTGDYKPPTPFD